MKIGIDIRMVGRKRTGDESVFLNLVKHLALIDGDNEYRLFIDERSSDELAAVSRSLGIDTKDNFRIIMLPARDKFMWNFWVLPRYLRTHPVDVYHTQYIVPFFIARMVKIVTHIHDVSFKVYPQYIGWKDRFFLSLLIPRSLRRADTIIAVSKFTKEEIVKHYALDEDKVSVVTNALSDDFLRDEKSSLEAVDIIRRKYTLPDVFMLYVGTLQPRKNVPALIRAFALAKESLPKRKLVIIGNRQGYHYDTGIDRAVEECGLRDEVIFTGFADQEDLPAIMRLAESFVFPSLYEGFGLPVLEAMSQGTPVLASDIAPLREVADDAALFVDTSDIAKFGEIMYTISIVAKVREELIAAGIRRTRYFSWHASATRLREIYQSLA